MMKQIAMPDTYGFVSALISIASTYFVDPHVNSIIMVMLMPYERPSLRPKPAIPGDLFLDQNIPLLF